MYKLAKHPHLITALQASKTLGLTPSYTTQLIQRSNLPKFICPDTGRILTCAHATNTEALRRSSHANRWARDCEITGKLVGDSLNTLLLNDASNLTHYVPLKPNQLHTSVDIGKLPICTSLRVYPHFIGRKIYTGIEVVND